MIVAGLDVAFSNDYMALVVIEESNDGKIRLRNLDTWRKIDWHLWKMAMKEKQSKFNIDWIYVDQTNNQSVVMELQYLGMRVEGVSFTNSAKNDMIRNATKVMVTGELIMPEIERIYSQKQQKMVKELFAQLEEQEYQHDTAHPKLMHPNNRHDDLLWALCLALYGIKTNNTGISIVMGLSNDDYEEKSTRDNVLDNVMRRFNNSGITITDVKLKMPGEK